MRGLLAIGLVLMAGCDIMSPGRDFDELREARARWEAHDQHDYTWTVRRLCFCGAPGLVEVRVEEGEVMQVVDLESGEVLGQETAQWFLSVDGLLDEVGRALREADAVEVLYDSETGAPLLLDVDWISEAIDDEIRWETTRPEW